MFGVVAGSRALSSSWAPWVIARAARVVRSPGPRGGLSVLGLVCHTRAPPNHRTSGLCLCLLLSADLGIREVSGRKREKSITSTALTERTKQGFSPFSLKSQINNQSKGSSTARASMPRSLLGPKGPRVVLPLKNEWSRSPDPGLLMRHLMLGRPS